MRFAGMVMIETVEEEYIRNLRVQALQIWRNVLMHYTFLFLGLLSLTPVDRKSTLNSADLMDPSLHFG
jgi:hypothetical protein